MTVPEFADFYRAIHADGDSAQEPFPWQCSLAQLVASAAWPQAFEVPTGLGKTAVLDVAVWSLARDVAEGRKSRAPRRIFLVVDRRLVVDQAYARATRIANVLNDSADPNVVAVANELRKLGEPDKASGERLLEVVRMRGGSTWASRWLRRPDLPAIVIGTVDQLGSRALFRGYGVGARRRPIDAALVGMDSLVIVDEVQLSHAFLDTVTSLIEFESCAAYAVARPMQLVQMSATVTRAAPIQLIGDADRSHSVAGPRLRAHKRARLVETTPKDSPKHFAAIALAHLRAVGDDTVAVVVNTVGLARRIFDCLLDQQSADKGPPFETALLIGRVRPVDRDRLQRELQPFLLDAASDGAARTSIPRVLVATQTVEVGVDLDVGALVTQAAPLDALVQRLGRLDRSGLRQESDVTIVHITGKNDSVYGPPSETTWELLNELGGRALALSKARSLSDLGPIVLDLGTESLEDLLAGIDRDELVARPAEPPVVLPTIVDVWARTSPTPVPDEPIAAYLHGMERASPLVSVVWRAVDGEDTASHFRALSRSLALVPVRSDEQVEVPLWEVVSLLQARGIDAGADVPELSDAADEDDDEAWEVACGRLVDSELIRCSRRADIRPGDTLIVPSTLGGYDKWGWTGEPGKAVADVADCCRPGGILRLQLPVLTSYGLEPSEQLVCHELYDAVLREAGELLAEVQADNATIGDLGQLADLAPLVEATRRTIQRRGWSDPFAPAVLADSDDIEDLVTLEPVDFTNVSVSTTNTGNEIDRPLTINDGLVLRCRPRRGRVLEAYDASDASTSGSGVRIELGQHSRDVMERARAIAERSGLSPVLSDAVALAAVSHDLGKADDRFQLSLYRGDCSAQEADGRILAKSGHFARHTKDWPSGLRHEALSATVLDELLDHVPENDSVDRELVRHLVCSHHGYGRPLFPARSTQEHEPSIRANFRVASPLDDQLLLASSGIDNQVDWDGPARFHSLCRRYGWWGLALLETIVRSADICVSEESAIGGSALARAGERGQSVP